MNMANSNQHISDHRYIHPFERKPRGIGHLYTELTELPEEIVKSEEGRRDTNIALWSPSP